MNMVNRGEIWLADLGQIHGSEQAGFRPVLIFQNDLLNESMTTVLAIPLTSNLKRASLPSCVLISREEGGLSTDSVILCHQLRVLDKTRLNKKLGLASQDTLSLVDNKMLFTMGII